MREVKYPKKLKLESTEQCEYYAAVSQLFNGSLETVQEIQPGELIQCK